MITHVKELIRAKAIELGATRCGFATAECIDIVAKQYYDTWIAQGKHGTMEYCAKYADVRCDPRLLLDGARTVICCAFCYNSGVHSPIIASYALGNDYHYVVKDILNRLGTYITQNFGGEVRAVVDTAPLRERYMAQKAGIGFIGINNQLIIPGLGSYFFLGELLWTGIVDADRPCTLDCGKCLRCVKACPGQALDGKGGCDARKCISYLTIEHRGELPQGTNLHGCVYGCDTCQTVCPHNADAPLTNIQAFKPNPEIATLTPAHIAAMTPSHYKRLTAHSALRRAPLKQLLRNLPL